jgi:predicted nucleic acid-binding Zn ribbon protein
MKLCPLLTTAYRLPEDRQCLGESCALYEKCHRKDRKAMTETIQTVLFLIALLIGMYIMKWM